ncbi:nuclear transport factor 2 family protein [Tateyamaria omphalii]|uniref:YybH family protein n=1 Tax=Tateyamaria omphalii TaxID=299262 RepID=UPI001C999D79|nr:nuclear transport factor 2 family protein [Tateyamaria omphalii]MBY5931580.1 nuclear transport factor 2 family protein [Tateyamaria omphalii]
MPQRIARQPRDIADCVNAYLQEGDLDGITSMFHPDCQIFFPPDQPAHRGIGGARKVFEEFIALKPRIESNVFSEVVNGDIALLQANWRVIAPDGTVMAEGQSTEVARRLENGGWGYLIDCPNGPPLHDADEVKSNGLWCISPGTVRGQKDQGQGDVSHRVGLCCPCPGMHRVMASVG